jgi:S-adenosylmethionine hydrolase
MIIAGRFDRPRHGGGVTVGSMTLQRGPTYRWITLTTDYGLSDGFAAAVHGVIGRQAPGVRVLDVTHLVPPGDVRRGAQVLAQTVPYLPVAVHVAVVDPGVGTARRALALETARGVLVGPDNGLLLPAAEVLGGVTQALELTNTGWLAEAVSATFHGRDVFAPVAARLATGAPISDAGRPLAVAELVRLPDPVVRLAAGVVEAEVVIVDRYGNVQLAAPGPTLAGLPAELTVGADHADGLPATKSLTFADVPEGQLIVFVDSAEMVAVAVNHGRAVDALAVEPGDLVRIAAR